MYEKLMKAGADVLYDDRDTRAGVKFADADLIGVPWQIVIGPRGVKAGVVEMKSRREGASEELSPEVALLRVLDDR